VVVNEKCFLVIGSKEMVKIFLAFVVVALASSCSSSNKYKVSQPTSEPTAARYKQALENQRRWEAEQREAQRQAMIQQENTRKQQQLAVDQVYDREFRQFLRSEGFSNASALASALRIRINYFRENPNPSENQKLGFFESLSDNEKENILKLEEPQFFELISKFEDDLQIKFARQQQVQSQRALEAYRAIYGNSGAGGGGYSMTCGFAPLPRLGCSIGRCVNGQWEQICN